MVHQQIKQYHLLSRWPELLLLLITSSHYIITVNLLADALILVGVLGIVMQLVAFIKMGQLKQYVDSLRVGTFRWRHFAFFNGQIDISLSFLADVNRLYGTAIAVFLLLQCPLNGLLAVALLSSDSESRRRSTLSGDLLALAYTVLSLQWLFIFIIHFFCIKVSKQLHSPAKRMLRLFVRSRGVYRVTERLKMVAYFEQFHTKNVFTVTYGRFGKITYESFWRQVFYYCKFLLFSLRLIK